MFDMISTIFKNLFTGPATRMHPHVKREPFPNVRGQVSGIDAETCIYCGICQRKCPALAIQVDKATKTWKLDPYKCVVCGVCEEVCPKNCLHMSEHYHQPVVRKEPLVISKPMTEEATKESKGCSSIHERA